MSQRSAAGAQIQPAREIRPNKTKQDQTKPSKFVWICLVESGLFKALWAKKTK
jgi:hypothetical protein